MDKHVFNPTATFTRGTSDPVKIEIRRIVDIAPHAIAGAVIKYEKDSPAVSFLFSRDAELIHVAESPQQIAALMGEAVERWAKGVWGAIDEHKEQSGLGYSRGRDSEREHKEHKEARNVVFCECEIPEGAPLDGSGWPLCRGPYGAPTYAKATNDARPVEIPGKDAVRGLFDKPIPAAESRADGPYNPEGVSEAGSSQTKIATGTGSISAAKLGSFFGGPRAPDRVPAQATTAKLPKDPVGVTPEYEQGTVAVRRSAKNDPSVGLEYFDAACAVWRPIGHPRLSEQFERAAFSLWSGN